MKEQIKVESRKSMKFKESNFFRAGVGYTIGNFMIKGITFLTVPIFARLLNTSEYGLVNIYLSYETIVSLVLGLGLHASIKNAKYEFDNLDEYCSSIIKFSLRNMLIVLGSANLFYSLYSSYVDFNLLIINLLLIHGFCDSIILSYNSRLALDYNYKGFLKLSIINTIVNIFLSIILILFVFTKDRFIGRILGLSLATILVAGYIIFLFFKTSRPTNNRKYIRYGLKFSLPLVPHGLSQVLLSQFDRIMIKNMVGISQAGIYSFCANIALIPTVILNSIDQVWMTWFFERMNKSEFYAIEKRAKYMLLLFSTIICFFTSFSPEMIKILAPKDYWDSVYSVIPIVLSTYFVFLYSFPSYVEYYFHRTKMIAFGSIMAALLNVILNYFMIQQFGYVAAAYTTLFSYFMYFIYHWIIARTITNIRLYNGIYFAKVIVLVVTQTFIQILFINSLFARIFIFLIISLILGLMILKEKRTH